jgi:hypothetical protein
MYSIVAATELFAGPVALAGGPKSSPFRDDESVTWALAPEAINAIAKTQSTDLVITETPLKFGASPSD